MAAANQRARDDLGIEEVIDVEAMTRTYSHLDHCDLSTDLVIVERDGRTIGYLRVDWNDLTNGTRQFFSFGILEPAERRQGIGQALLSWSEARLAEIAASLPQDRTGQLFAYTRDRDPGAKVLFERNGWQPVARGYDMVRPTLDDIAGQPAAGWPRGPPRHRGGPTDGLGGRARGVPRPPRRGGVDRGGLGDLPGRLPGRLAVGHRLRW